ncbi:MAG TPA: anti-sigma factor [Gaiellaceae bacterium]|nr:anti-sigma factor [Gaiellaceae bacterium]
MSGPEFDDLVGRDVPADERERLRHVHDLLVEAGAPPELPEGLQPVPDEERANVYPLFPKRRWAAAAALAAALAAATFGVGYLVGDREATAEPARVVVMDGTSDASAARASLAVYDVDEAGNWPMELTVRGLPPLPGGELYELWLTKDGKLAAPCGVFAVGSGTTVVPLTAPYSLRDFDGWIVVRQGSTEPVLTT